MMTFSAYMGIQALALIIVTLLLSYYVGRISRQYRENQARIEDLRLEFDCLQPKNRLPSKREKRAMKNVRRKLAHIEHWNDYLGRKMMVVNLVILGAYLWMFVSLMATDWWFKILVAPIVVIVAELMYSGGACRWTKAETVLCAVMVLGIVLLVFSMTTRTNEILEGPVGSNQMEDAMADKYHDDGLVGTILNDEDDVYYKKHRAELAEYTDGLGLDLDRLLYDYGYDFFGLVRDESLAYDEKTYRNDFYWITYLKSDRSAAIMIDAFGERIFCFDSEVMYVMLPEDPAKPNILASLGEKEYIVNQKVVALLMEFLGPQEKVTRNAETSIEMNVV